MRDPSVFLRRRARQGLRHEPGRVSGIVLVSGKPAQDVAIIERFDLFESWWVWPADFRADDGGLVTGNVLHGTVIPPVPLTLRLEAADGGTHAEVAWPLRMHSAPLRVTAMSPTR